MISVVIPTLNAARHLPATFLSIFDAAIDGFVREVIVSDGGSTDATLKIADAAGATVIAGERGRGLQLRAGAQAARGRWLLFLHADTALERGSGGGSPGLHAERRGRRRGIPLSPRR